MPLSGRKEALAKTALASSSPASDATDGVLMRSTCATELQLQSKQREGRCTTWKYATGCWSRYKNSLVRLDPMGVNYELPPAAMPSRLYWPPRCWPPLQDQKGTIFLAHGHVPQHTRHQKRQREQPVVNSSPWHSKSISASQPRLRNLLQNISSCFVFSLAKWSTRWSPHSLSKLMKQERSSM